MSYDCITNNKDGGTFFLSKGKIFENLTEKKNLIQEVDWITGVPIIYNSSFSKDANGFSFSIVGNINLNRGSMEFCFSLTDFKEKICSINFKDKMSHNFFRFNVFCVFPKNGQFIDTYTEEIYVSSDPVIFKANTIHFSNRYLHDYDDISISFSSVFSNVGDVEENYLEINHMIGRYF